MRENLLKIPEILYRARSLGNVRIDSFANNSCNLSFP
jgi:hypothetical protein